MNDNETPSIGYNHFTTNVKPTENNKQGTPDNFDEYRLPEDYFLDLYTNPVGTEEYKEAQSQLYQTLAFEDTRASEVDAVQVTRALERGDIEIAENIVHEVLEQ